MVTALAKLGNRAVKVVIVEPKPINTVLKEIGEGKIIAKISHHEQKHVNIYREGDPLDILDPKTLESIAQFNVTFSRFVDEAETEIELGGYFTDGIENAAAGCLIENSLKIASVHIHHNNFSFYPRILALGSGDIIIEDNHLSNCVFALRSAIAPDYWYESGGTTDVLIEGNCFERCGYCVKTWGKAVITGSPRKEFDGKRYFHGTIAIRNNRFTDNSRALVRLANVTHAVFDNNEIENTVSPNVYTDCYEVSDDTL